MKLYPESPRPTSPLTPLTLSERRVLLARYDAAGRVLRTYAEIAASENIPAYKDIPAHAQAYFIRCRALNKLHNARRKIRRGDPMDEIWQLDLDLFAAPYAQVAPYLDTRPLRVPM